MKNKINISIPKPCQENWLEMTPSEQGRFCQLCNKNVFDFTQSSDREIVKAIEKDAFLCGRFTDSQLDRELIVSKEKSSIWLATTSAIISFLGLGSNEVIAQEKVKVEQTDKKILEQPKREIVTISGIVVDYDDVPLADVEIHYKGNVKPTKTDINGRFSIEAYNCSRIEFSQESLDFELYNYDYKVDGENLNAKIVCEKYLIRKVQKCTVGGLRITEKKFTFFGRIFRSIGNWFK